MKVGAALNMPSEPGRPGTSVIHEHFAMGDRAVPLRRGPEHENMFALA